MITCKSCGTEYEDYASYCNTCDLPLSDESGESLNKELSGMVDDTREVLLKARKTASSVHRLIGWMYFLLLAISAFFLAMSNADRIREYLFLLILALPAAIHLLAAEGLVRNKSWARPLSIVVGIILLVGFPIGTILGGIILSQMFKKEWQIA